MIELDDIKTISSQADLDHLVAQRYAGDIEAFVEDVNQSVHKLLRTNMQAAESYVETATRLGRLLPSRFKARFDGMRARVCHRRGDYKRALRYYRQARQAFRRRRDFEAYASMGRGLMDVYLYLGRYNQALDIGKKSLRYFKIKGLTADAAQVMTNIGNVYHRLDNNRMALRYYDQAREIFKSSGGVPLAIVEYNRANVFTNVNDLRQARALYGKAADIYHRKGLEIAAAQAEYSLAYLAFLEDDYTRATAELERLAEAFDALGDVKSAAVARLDLIEINVYLNQHGQAVLTGRDLLAQFRKLGMRYEEAKTAYFVGWAALQLAEQEIAARYLRMARRLFEAEQNHLWLGMVLVAEARLKSHKRRYKDALSVVAQSISHFQKSKDYRRTTDAHIARVEILLISRNVRRAEREARQLLQGDLISYQRHRLYHLLGRCRLDAGDTVGALYEFRQAVQQVEQMLEGLYPDEVRFFFALDKLDSYRMMIDCQLQLDRQVQAFNTNLRALEAINYSPDPHSVQRTGVPQELLDERRQLRAALRKFDRTPAEVRETAATSSYREVEQKLWANERRIRSHVYSRRDDRDSARDRLTAVQERLTNDQVLIHYVAIQDRVGVFLVERDAIRFVDLHCSAEELDVSLRKLHFALERSVRDPRSSGHYREAIESHLRSLYGILVQPVRNPYVDADPIIVVDGVFSQVPFHALLDGNGQYVWQTSSIRLITDPSRLQRRRTQRSLHLDDGAVFAVASAQLPSVAEEADGIRSSFPKTRVYTNEQAVTEQFHEELRRVRGFVHIATHASRASENPLFSRILLEDGPFFPFELFGRRLRQTLVTLSGCQTAAPGLYANNSFSLARAFYQAGCEQVLASLWPVSDKLTMLFMTRFYRFLKETASVERAYRMAMKELFKISSLPATWGSFILLGG